MIYRILIAQDVEYLRCVINEVRSTLSTCYRVGDSLLSVVILHPICNMVGTVLILIKCYELRRSINVSRGRRKRKRKRERRRLIEEQQLREQTNIKKYGVADPSIRLNLFLPSMTETTALRLLSDAEKQIKSFYSINKYKF